jgi:ribonuclease P protein component
MLSRIHRLPAVDIPLVMKRGARVAKAGFILIQKKRVASSGITIQSEPRFAFVVSTKVDKRATVRNRVRRILQEIARLNIGMFPKDSDIVVIVQKSAVAMPRDQIEKQLLNF